MFSIYNQAFKHFPIIDCAAGMLLLTGLPTAFAMWQRAPEWVLWATGIPGPAVCCVWYWKFRQLQSIRTVAFRMVKKTAAS